VDDDIDTEKIPRIESLPCNICGFNTSNIIPDVKCLGCIETEYRLPRYLASREGRARVRDMIAAYDDTDSSIELAVPVADIPDPTSPGFGHSRPPRQR